MKKMTRMLAAGVTLLATTTAMAADYPARPIQVIVPYSAGGGTDLSTRILADVFSDIVDGATMIVRDQPGGGGAIGTSAGLHSTPNGYTLGTGSQGPLAILPHFGGTDYSIDDVQFLGLIGRNLQVLLACANAPFKTFDEMMAYGKKSPIEVGNTGAGGANHISAEAFAKAAKIKIKSIPYAGSGESVPACVGGHVQAIVSSPSEALNQSKSGKVTPIFVMEEKRISTFPDVPTAVEKGINFTWSSWKGIIAPKGMPSEVVTFLKSALKKVITNPTYLSRMEKMGEFVEYRDAQSYEALAKRDSKMAEEVVRDLGMYGMNK